MLVKVLVLVLASVAWGQEVSTPFKGKIGDLQYEGLPSHLYCAWQCPPAEDQGYTMRLEWVDPKIYGWVITIGYYEKHQPGYQPFRQVHSTLVREPAMGSPNTAVGFLKTGKLAFGGQPGAVIVAIQAMALTRDPGLPKSITFNP